MNINETYLRTLFKTISWRVLLTISHLVNGYLITGSFSAALKIAGIATVINSIIYWSHERSWNLTKWNRVPNLFLHFKERHPRTISKSVTWRLLITLSNFFVPYFLTGSFGSAAMFLGLATVVNIAIFYLHERGWNIIRYGKQ